MGNKLNDKYPQQLIDAVAELLLPEIQKFYESDEGRQFLEEWVKDKKTGGDGKQRLNVQLCKCQQSPRRNAE